MATELKTNAWHRYMLYRRDEQYMTFKSGDKRREAVDTGKQFAASAYADVWANDAELVKRVRVFLGENFHWHDRLARTGADIDVVQTLMDMVRGGSVVVIPEKPIFRGGMDWPPKKPASSSFWGVENYDPPRYASVKERYLAQIEELQANETPWAEIEAMNDSINQKFMHAAVLIDPLGTLPTFARAGWISKYGLPDLSNWGREEEDGDTLKVDEFGETGDDGASTPLGDAQPFEYGEEAVREDGFDIAKTPNYGEPGTWYTNPGSRQMRLYGDGGGPVVDFDFDHDHGQGVPHAHNWAVDPLTGKSKRGAGLPMSVLP